MDAIKGIFDSLRLTLYEWMAVLLPGIAGVECIRLLLLPIRNFLPGSAKAGEDMAVFGATSVIAYLVLTYLAGIGLQGASSVFMGIVECILRCFKKKDPSETEKLALSLARNLLRGEIPQQLLVSFCLSRIDVKRTAYERFTALRDMCRALTLVAIIAMIAVLCADGDRLASEYRPWAFGTALLMVIALWERYIRYRPLANEALFGLFISNEIPAPPKP